ncbi:SRR1-like protein [Ictalurus punctatus]|uniref:SRR1-like protein n=1 Tax=Ictalurus punctatus TaxID=7998 RepID=A0A2D0R1K3_ICTPU|nr:SRR1-like protein [Ictalurus punctatus]
MALMADSSEWKSVRRGRGGARKGKLSQLEKTQAPESVDRERDKRRITEAINELKCEDFWPEWKEIFSGCLAETVDKTVEGTDCIMECICYGLGNFSSCVSARYQLAMLLLLLEALQIHVGWCSLYDPVFTVSECETLRELGFAVLIENEEGKRAVCHPTLFYLMHCGKALYNNLLWKNWSPQILPKVTIIGNSFLGIQERMLQRELERDYRFLSDVTNVCEETSLPCSQRFLDVFNDTALIRFPLNKLHQLPKSMWDEPSEPQYEHCQDLEIIQRVKEPK